MAPRSNEAPVAGKKGGMKQGKLFSFFSKKAEKPVAAKTLTPKEAVIPPAAAPPPKNHKELEKVQLGGRIEVYWADDEDWYGAIVSRKRCETSFYVQYDDGQCEWIDLSTESFRLPPPKKKRRIQESDDEGECEMQESGEESAYKEDEIANNDDDEEDDDQWMVTDDEDDEQVSSGKKAKNTTKTTELPKKKSSASTGRPSSASSKAVSSLSRFAAVKVTDHPAGKTPSSRATTPRPVITPGLSLTPAGSTQSSPPASVACKAKHAPPPFTPNALNVAGSHVHNHLPFLQNPLDSQGRPPDHSDYDPRTLNVQSKDWIKITGKNMTDAVKQWWDLKSQYNDTVLLFKTGKFYELYHMDADVGVQVCGLIYMKGHVAHCGFPEIAYGENADKLVRAGYKVARVEQTETPDQLKERKKKSTRGSAPKVVNREVCSVMTLGTRTFCYLDDKSDVLDEVPRSEIGPLLAIREVLLATNNEASDDAENVQPVCEYGVTLVDAVRGSVTLGQFADDVLRSRMVTLLTTFSPSEILIEGGEHGASATLQSLLRSLQTTSKHSFRVEIVRGIESFPQSTALDPGIRKQLERGGRERSVHPWDVEETLQELHRRKYYPRGSKREDDLLSFKRWPRVLRAAVEGNAKLALSSFGAVLFYLQRNLIDSELLSMGIVKAYIPPESAAASNRDEGGIRELATEQDADESGVQEPTEQSASAPSESSGEPTAMDVDLPESLDLEKDITHMALDGTTLHNLEILTNAVDQKVAGSLWQKINYTKSPHGARLLRAWLLRPLFRKADIERRQEAVQELASGAAAVALSEARSVLSKCGDIERLLSRVHSMSGFTMPGDDDDENSRIHPNDRAVLYETAAYTKRKVGDFSKVLQGLRSASQIPELFNGIEIQSGLLRKIVHFNGQGGCFPNMADDLEWFFENFDCEMASQGHFEPGRGIDDRYDEVTDTVERIIAELNAYKDEMCSTVLSPPALARTSWTYANTKIDSKDKYLIELPANVEVPDDFIMKGKRGSGRKQVNKYRTAVVEELVGELEQAYELQSERKTRGMELIFAKFDSKRTLWAAAAQATALLDAIGSLAQTASKPGYVRPKILECSIEESPKINIVQGRHPCIENTFNSSEFIPNDLVLGCDTSENKSPRVLLLSGPNMGGKSTLLRQTCLISILAQLGGFVPAEACELTPVDRIFTRLGASDRILMNQSTFFVELAETAAALRGATRRSLVIMDELGRGTSTFDGTAIASATVQHLVERSKCLSLFATHYHSLLEEWKADPSVVLGHMQCLVEDNLASGDEGDGNITFLYTLGEGVCPKSFGINVARLAGLPDDVLQNAKRISREFEQEMSDAGASSAIATKADQKRAILQAIESESWEELLQLWQTLQQG